MATDLLQIKSSILEEKEKVSLLETKMELMNHLLADSEDIKLVVSQAATKIEKRLEAIEAIIKQMNDIKG